MKFIYGPIPSRRLGFSLGISAIPKKTCNYSCIYCQLGRTNHLTNSRQMFYPVEDIVQEFEEAIKGNVKYDVVSIVGEGEPTLYLGLGKLIKEIKLRTDKPVAVITNGAYLFDENVQEELMNADIVLPSLNAYNEETFKKINRSSGQINFHNSFEGLKSFSKNYKGEIWLEIMFVQGYNDDDESLLKFKELLKEIRYDRLYLNTPVRPPAEDYVVASTHQQIEKAVELLGGISIDLLSSKVYQSSISDDYEAIISIIQRHPMNQHEIEGFLRTRDCNNVEFIFLKLQNDNKVVMINYKGYIIYRLK